MDLAIHDEMPGTARTRVLHLSLRAPTITAEALIRARVELEVEQFLADQTHGASESAEARAAVLARLSRHLIVPDRVEQRLNGPRGAYGPGSKLLKQSVLGRYEPDTEAMVETALKAFRTGRFFLLVNDRQIETLDTEIPLRATTDVVFLKLMPLQGG